MFFFFLVVDMCFFFFLFFHIYQGFWTEKKGIMTMDIDIDQGGGLFLIDFFFTAADGWYAYTLCYGGSGFGL